MNFSWGRVLGGVFLRAFACVIVAITLLFAINDYLIFWLHWPGTIEFLEHKQWFWFGPLSTPLEGYEVTLGWLQLLSYATSIVLVLGYVLLTPTKSLRADADNLSAMAAYTIRSAFWSVFLIGIVDMGIIFLRVGLLQAEVGPELAQEPGVSRFRGVYLHYPVILVSLVIAYCVRSVSFAWLLLLVVVVEIHIAVSRFLFSYEHALIEDLVRCWYVVLGLFAVAHALVHDRDVGDDVSYIPFSDRRKAWAGIIGAVVLGVPSCWIILSTGMWEKGASINSLLLGFEIYRGEFGPYATYLAASFLVLFAVAMTMRFMSDFLNNAASLRNEPRGAKTRREETDEDLSFF